MNEEQLLAIKEKVAPRLLSLPGVCGVGLGFKHVAGQQTDRPCIMVFVVTKLPRGQVPKEQLVPSEVQGVPTDVYEMGDMRAQAGPCNVEDFDEDTDEYDPLMAGSRLHVRYEDLPYGPGELITLDGIASLGCFATTNTNPAKHVFITVQHGMTPNTNHPLPGFAGCPSEDENARPLVGQPRVRGSDCSPCCKRVAGIVTKLDFDHDCAVVEIKRGEKYKNEIAQLGVIQGKRTLNLGILNPQFKVIKRGCITRRRTGVALSVHTDVNYASVCDTVDGQGNTVFARPLHKLIMIRPDEDASCYSSEGDSGAPVVDETSNLIGLHVAGGGQLAAALPVEAIESTLGITILTGDKGVVTVSTPNVELAPANRRLTMDEDDPILVAGRRAREELKETPLGRAIGSAVETNLDELLRLANHNRSFKVLWHRSGGPSWLMKVLQCVERRTSRLPSEMKGVRVEDALGRILDELCVRGSPGLAAAVEQHRTWLLRVSGKTYDEVLAELRAQS